MKRILSAIIGFIFVGIVIFLGVNSGIDSRFIIPYGLASALIAPLGISALGYSIRKEDPTLKRLALIPEIDNLIEKAETESQKIKRLKREKEELLAYIKTDTKRIALLERKKLLELDIQRSYEEYVKVNTELIALVGEELDIQEMSSEIRDVITKNSETSLTIFGERYVVENIFDFYNLPAIVITNGINKLVIVLITGIQRLINIILNNK